MGLDTVFQLDLRQHPMRVVFCGGIDTLGGNHIVETQKDESSQRHAEMIVAEKTQFMGTIPAHQLTYHKATAFTWQECGGV